ncbi:MAG: hypothetical protein IIY78_10390 [Clostridia bacterium]|nr:hypothetical protein [Clostridia bacterium]
MTDEQKNTELLVRELVRLCEKRYEVCVSDFLNEGQQAYAKKALIEHGCKDYLFYGGYENSERNVLAVFPEYVEVQKEELPITALHVKFRESADITHRDVLGSLMGLGIKREKIGDIVIENGRATFFVKTELSGYVKSQLEKIGREGVSFCETGADLTKAAPKLSVKNSTVASVRLDAVVGECANMSRSKAQLAVKSGAVFVNSLTVDKCDTKITSGDKISIRGSGKYIVEYDGELSKKGKYKITISKYV